VQNNISDKRSPPRIVCSGGSERRHDGHRLKVSADVLYHVAWRERFVGFEGWAFLFASAARNARIELDELAPLELLNACYTDFAGLLDLLDRYRR
jgi:hypothetical protein